MSRDLKAPDHTTLSRRNQIVVVPPLTRAHDGPIDLIVDSQGSRFWSRRMERAQAQGIEETPGLGKLHIGVDCGGVHCGGRTHSEQPGRRLHTP